jgi:hypothetical protein
LGETPAAILPTSGPRDLWAPDPAFLHQEDTADMPSLLQGGLTQTDHTFAIGNQTNRTYLQFQYSFSFKVMVDPLGGPAPQATVGCPMDFGRFPFDSHSCPFLLHSLRGQAGLRWPRSV